MPAVSSLIHSPPVELRDGACYCRMARSVSKQCGNIAVCLRPGARAMPPLDEARLCTGSFALYYLLSCRPAALYHDMSLHVVLPPPASNSEDRMCSVLCKGILHHSVPSMESSCIDLTWWSIHVRPGSAGCFDDAHWGDTNPRCCDTISAGGFDSHGHSEGRAAITGSLRWIVQLRNPATSVRTQRKRTWKISYMPHGVLSSRRMCLGWIPT